MNFSVLNKEKLIILSLTDNNFFEQDLSILSHLTNLKELYLGTFSEDRINKDVYNRFTGSLKFLKDMDKLENLNIIDTYIDSGVEYLPFSLKEVKYLGKRSNSRVKEIKRELDFFIEKEKRSN